MAILGKIVKWADRATQSWSTRAGANLLFLARYGKMTQLKIDREKKTLTVEVELKGESVPVRVSVDAYAFEKLADGTGRIHVAGVKVSREWMQELAGQFAEGKSFVVPAEIAGYLALVL